MRFLIFCVLYCLVALCCSGQTNPNATIGGLVVDANGKGMAGVSVKVLGKQTGITTNDSGRFELVLRAGRALALEFTYVGYKTRQQNFYLSPGEIETVTIVMEPGLGTLETVTVNNRRNRQESGSVTINPKQALVAPTPIGGIENLIKIQVGDGNELSSQYKVRGGNYDENLVYVNDFEVFRPYLIRNGQQEGLSFINPELARSVSFYNGGFQARYGDKMSSVLDVEYKQPTRFGGSAYAGLLEQGAHLE
ncbi:MAG: TonB-dependent receptor, partial [Bacteroidetes bacterium]